MKKSILFLSAILIIAFLKANEPKKNGVHSVAEFEKLYQSKEFPCNKISDTTFLRLKNGIAFDNEGRFRGFSFIGGLRKELTFEEYNTFFELISGSKMEYEEGAKEEYERRKNIK